MCIRDLLFPLESLGVEKMQIFHRVRVVVHLVYMINSSFARPKSVPVYHPRAS